MKQSIIGKEVLAPIWGANKPVFLTSWPELQKLGFKKRDRSFGQLEDGTPALFFYATKFCCSLSDDQLNNCTHDWYVITETLDEISD